MKDDVRHGADSNRDRLAQAGTAIRVANLSKVYKLYKDPMDRLKESVHPLRKRYFQPFHALRDVSFEVYRGETVGIVGRNGSGKSTLLKIITGVLTPTEGTVEVNGKVSAILELGAGFNPELSGLENVYFSGTLMGYTREEMDDKLDAILAFADIGDFVHQPVKTYSSGMLVRLAFSVQTTVEANILIVDEALAVGDEAFQRKCFARLEQLRKRGATLLYVSHQASSVVALCNHALLMHFGELILQGKPKYVVSRYQRLAHAPAGDVQRLVAELKAGKPEPAAAQSEQHKALTAASEACFDPHFLPKSTVNYDPNGAIISDVRITTEEGDIVNMLVRRETYLYQYNVEFTTDCESICFGMLVKTNSGFPLGGATSSSTRKKIPFVPRGTLFDVTFRFKCLLNPGVYFFNAGIEGTGSDNPGPYLHRIVDAAMFRVQEEPEQTATGFIDFHVVTQVVQKN